MGQETVIKKNPYTDEVGFKTPILIFNENGHTIQYTNRHDEAQVLTHLGLKPEGNSETFHQRFDMQTGLKLFKELKDDPVGLNGSIIQHMNKTQKPLVITNEYKDALIEEFAAVELKKAARASLSSPMSVSKAASGEKSVAVVSSATVDDTDTVSKGGVYVAPVVEDAVPEYEDRLSTLKEGNEGVHDVGKIFGFAAFTKKFQNFSLQDIAAKLFGSKSDDSDNNQKLEM